MEIFRATPADPIEPASLYTSESIIQGLRLHEMIQIAKLAVGEEYLGADDVVWERIA